MCIMLEDCINSSPSKSNESIRETRLKRKSRRKHSDQSVQCSFDNEQSDVGFLNVIKEFYKDSDEEATECVEKQKNSTSFAAKPPAVINNFKPFELEKSLAIADHVSGQVEQNKRNIAMETDGFISCTSLNEPGTKTDFCKETNNESSSFTITESELLSCCHQAEYALKNAEDQYNVECIKHAPTPNTNDNLMLVNSILDDFSQSPLSKEQIVSVSWQYTPEFRLRKKPVKSYSRRFLNRTKSSLNLRFEQLSKSGSSENDDAHSSCSSLSVQEDVSFIQNNLSAVTNTSSTQHLCENLLNLTEYFAQNLTEQNIADKQRQNAIDLCSLSNSEDKILDLHNMPDLITNILTLRSTYPDKNRYDSYNSVEDFYGFSSDENAMDSDNENTSTFNSNLYMKHDSNVCGSKHSAILINNKESKILDDFFEDDDQDIFSCINIEGGLQQKSNNLYKVVENHLPSSPKNYGHCGLPDIAYPVPSSCIGFKTASSKAIKVSREAHVMASKILSKLPDIPNFDENTQKSYCDTKTINKDVNILENPEDYEWNDDCDLFLNFQTPVALNENCEIKNKQQQMLAISQQHYDIPTTSKEATRGFNTASGKNVYVSNKAQKTVQELLKEFTNFQDANSKVYSETESLQYELSSVGNIEQQSKNIGFETAKGNNFKISMTDQQNPKNVKNEFCLGSEQNYEQDLKAIKEQINSKNFKLKKQMADFQICPKQNIDITKITPEESKDFKQTNVSKIPHNINNVGFETAGGNIIKTSTKAQQSVKELLKEFAENPDIDFVSDLKTIKDDVYKKNYKYKINKCTNDISDPTDKTDERYKNNKHSLLENCNANENILINDGSFQTANGKQITVSTKSKQIVEQLLQEFKTVSYIDNYENDLKEMKEKLQIKNSDLKSIPIPQENEYIDNEYPNSPKVCNNLTCKTISGKRKNSMDNDGLDSPVNTPCVKIIKNDVDTPKPNFAEQSLKSPLATSVHSLILRKNLLSLTKRRKSKINAATEETPKINHEIYDLNMNATTPIKASISLIAGQHAAETPNLKDFLSNAPLTSTPRINKPTQSQQTIKDSDFKPITWQNNNSISDKSASINISNNSDFNITLNSSNPTPKERMERLKMYGEAPPVSPILIETNHNCRPSGLRRTRSMFKKTGK